MCNLPESNRHPILRYFLIVLTFITINNIVYGQEKSGTVTNSFKPLSGAVIANLKTRKLAISNDNGEFKMVVNTGDTLTTSYMGLQIDTLVFHNENPINIVLKPLPNVLQDVTITDFWMSPLDKLLQNQEDYKQIYRLGNFFDIDKGMPSTGLRLNLQTLLSVLSRERRNARHLQKTLIRDYYEDIVDTRFTRDLVTQYTGYEGHQLDNFMINNRPSYDFIKDASDYDLIVYIKKAAKDNPSPKGSDVVTDQKAE